MCINSYIVFFFGSEDHIDNVLWLADWNKQETSKGKSPK